MAYRDYVGEITGVIPKLPLPYAQIIVQRAWSNIRDMRLWSWLIGTGDLFSAANVFSGTVTTTLGSPTVFMDAVTSAALAPLVSANPPLVSTSLGTGRQIRIGNTGSAGPLYSIIAADFTVNVLTLDRPYTGPSGSGWPYQVYKCYFAPPSTDFLRYFTVTNMRSGYTIRGKKLYYTQLKLNAVDSQRGGTGDAYIVSDFKMDSTGRPVHEWYPHPVNAAAYNCVYQKRGTDLSDTVDLPATFPSSCLMARAYVLAADWALANVAAFPELGGTNWVMWKQSKQGDYKEELMRAVKQDDEIRPLTPVLQGSYFDFPLGGQFLQGHDVSSLIGDAT